MPPKRSALGRNATPARVFAPSASPARRNARNTPVRAPTNPPVENPQLPDLQTEQSFSYGSTKTPLLPRQLKARTRMTTAQIAETIDEAKAQEDANIRAYKEEAQRQVDQGANERDLRAARRSVSRDSNQSVDPSVNGDSEIGRSTATTPTTRRAASLAQSHDLSPVDEDETDSDGFDQDSVQLQAEDDSQAEDDAQAREDQQTSQESIPRIPPRSPIRKIYDWVGDISFRRERSFFQGVDDASVVAEEHEQKQMLQAFLDILWTPVEFVAYYTRSLHPEENPPPNSITRKLLSATFYLIVTLLATMVLLSVYADRLPEFGYRIGRTASNLKIFFYGVSDGFHAPIVNLDPHDSTPPDVTTDNPAAVAIVDARLSAFSSTFSSSLSSQAYAVSTHSANIKSLQNSIDTLSSSKSIKNAQHATLATPPWSNKINYASSSHGAIIDPYLTSPTYQRPFPLLTRLLSPSTVKEFRSRIPAEALKRWTEYGECWCASPSTVSSGDGGKSKGKGAVQLAVLLGQRILPTEVVLEFLAKDVNPGWTRTPKRMEVWADYGHLDARDFVEAEKDSLVLGGGGGGGDGGGSDTGHRSVPDGFLRVGILDLEEQTLSLSRSSSTTSSSPSAGDGEGRLGQAAPLKRLGPLPAGYETSKLVFVITDNFGGDVTCLYRVRVHGEIKAIDGGDGHR
ncbi:MAG: hypothetical protein Q9160_005454 [Pyrenula sp. 1 TL-2023]